MSLTLIKSLMKSFTFPELHKSHVMCASQGLRILFDYRERQNNVFWRRKNTAIPNEMMIVPLSPKCKQSFCSIIKRRSGPRFTCWSRVLLDRFEEIQSLDYVKCRQMMNQIWHQTQKDVQMSFFYLKKTFGHETTTFDFCYHILGCNCWEFIFLLNKNVSVSSNCNRREMSLDTHPPVYIWEIIVRVHDFIFISDMEKLFQFKDKREPNKVFNRYL